MILNLGDLIPSLAESAFIAPDADVIGGVTIGENSSVWFHAVLRGDVEPIRVGAHSNIQDGSVVHGMAGSPVEIGDWVTVGHRAVLHGCVIENHCLIGMGAIILNHARIGEGSIIAAGSLVVQNTVVPPRSLYMGVPARFERQLTDAGQAYIDKFAHNYLRYQERYLAEMEKRISR